LRNVFGLSDAVVTPPPPVDPAPPPNVTLIGLSTLMSVPQAIVVVKPPSMPGKPAPAEETYIMNQGERRGELELLRVNVKAGTAKIKLEGVESTISMRTNAPMMRAAAPTPPGGVGAFPRPPAYTPPPPAGYAPPAQPGVASAGQGGYYSGASPNSSNPDSAGGINGGQSAIPPRPVRTDQPPALSQEEQTLMIEAQRQDAIQRGDSMAIILPPTEMSPPGFGGDNGQQTQNPNVAPTPR